MKIEVQAQINQEVDLEVHLEDVLQAMDELEPRKRWNYTAWLLNNWDPGTLEELDDEAREIIVKYLEKQLEKFKK